MGWTTRRFTAGILAIALASTSLPARAQDSPDELARRHFESGVAYLQEADYDSALKAFQKAYELSKRPEILINIATVHERKGDLKAAVSSLEKYLEVAPEGDQRSTVEARIANLKKRIDEQDAAAKAAAANNTGPSNPSGPTPGATGSASTSTPPDVPARSNVPAYVLLGIGGLTAAGAVLTGVLAKSEYDDAKEKCSPNCTDDDVSSGKSLALMSTVLTGVAVVSASIGAVLFFTNQPSTPEKAARRKRAPQWSVAVGPEGAGANALFRF